MLCPNYGGLCPDAEACQQGANCVTVRKTGTTGESTPAGVGVKYDQEKARVDLIPPDALMALGHVYGFGARKYGDRNWEHGLHYSRNYAALLRHLYDWYSGRTYDEEGNLLIAQVAWNAIALLTFELRGMTEFDDRPVIASVRNDGNSNQSSRALPKHHE